MKNYLDQFPVVRSCRVCRATEAVPPFVELLELREVVNRAAYPKRWMRVLARTLRIDRVRYACSLPHLEIMMRQLSSDFPVAVRIPDLRGLGDRTYDEIAREKRDDDR